MPSQEQISTAVDSRRCIVPAEEAAPTRELPTEKRTGKCLVTPESAQPLRINWPYVISLAVVHVLSLLALIPWLFSWTGVALVLAGHLIFGMLGITVGWHRLLTHRSFTCPKWLEYFFATLGACCLQDSPARWVAIHRIHHQNSDQRPDPHSPIVNFFWGHVGWLLVLNRDHDHVLHYERYVRDLLRDPFYLRFERRMFWLWTYIVHSLLYFVAGLAIGWATSGEYLAGLQFGLSLLVWGVFVRTVVELHSTWSVNSLGHLFGYQNYQTGDHSRNNWLVALTSHGEGWHNNHHADQRCAFHGHKWWEFDPSSCVIRMLELFGLAKDVVRPDSKSSALNHSR